MTNWSSLFLDFYFWKGVTKWQWACRPLSFNIWRFVPLVNDWFCYDGAYLHCAHICYLLTSKLFFSRVPKKQTKQKNNQHLCKNTTDACCWEFEVWQTFNKMHAIIRISCCDLFQIYTSMHTFGHMNTNFHAKNAQYFINSSKIISCYFQIVYLGCTSSPTHFMVNLRFKYICTSGIHFIIIQDHQYTSHFDSQKIASIFCFKD